MSASFPSLEKLEKICSKNPTSILFARLAEGFLEHGQVKRATEICRQGLRYRPSYVAGHVVMGKCHLAVGHFEEARQEFQKVLQLDADHPAALWHLGQIDLKLGWEDLALRHFELALVLDPFNDQLQEQIAKLKSDTSVPEKIENTIDDDICLEETPDLDRETEPDFTPEETASNEDEPVVPKEDGDVPIPELVVDEGLSDLVSELAQHTVDEPLPIEDVPPKLQTNGTQSIATATLAELYAEQGLVEQAVATLERVLERDPNNAQILARLDELRT